MLWEKDYALIMVDIGTPLMNCEELYQYLEEKRPKLADYVIFATRDILEGNTASFF